MSDCMARYRQTLQTMRNMIASLEKDADAMADEAVRQCYFELDELMQTNCESAASGLLATLGAICAHKAHLAGDLLPRAMQPIYYLGIEDLAGVQAVIRWVARQEDSYFNTHTKRLFEKGSRL